MSAKRALILAAISFCLLTSQAFGWGGEPDGCGGSDGRFESTDGRRHRAGVRSRIAQGCRTGDRDLPTRNQAQSAAAGQRQGTRRAIRLNGVKWATRYSAISLV